MGGRQGRDDVEVLWVEDVAGDEGYRVCLLRRFEEVMPDVREFCKSSHKYKVSSESFPLRKKGPATLA
jgi:hypothetical protein